MQIHRRRFMQQTVASAAIASGLQSTIRAEDTKSLPIIDTHQHLWDMKQFTPPWLADAPDVIAKPHVTADFIKATEGLNVVKAVYMEVDVDPNQQVAEAEYVIKLSESDDDPTAAE